MATAPVSQVLNRGGAFLITPCRPEDVFTPADFSDDQRLIGQTAEEFVQKEVVPAIPELEAHKDEHLMAQMLKKAGEIGLLGGGIPEAYGGSGLDKISAAVLAEKLAGYGSFAVSHGGHAGIGTVPIVYFGTEEQKKKYLPKIATGELLSCYCLSEPQAGSDSMASRTRAVLSPDGKNYILNGQKMWITNGGFADVYVVFAKIDGEKFSCFIVERGTPGFTAGAESKAAPPPPSFSKTPRFRKRISCTNPAAAMSSPSTRSTPVALAWAPIASAAPRKFWKLPRNIPRSAPPSASASAISA
jgi:hypothetical protein